MNKRRRWKAKARRRAARRAHETPVLLTSWTVVIEHGPAYVQGYEGSTDAG
jgi:hypothetical protein